MYQICNSHWFTGELGDVYVVFGYAGVKVPGAEPKFMRFHGTSCGNQWKSLGIGILVPFNWKVRGILVGM